MRELTATDIDSCLYIYSMVYVLSKETTLTSLADLQIGSQLTKDYSVMITSRPVLEQVIKNQGLNMTYGQLKARIRISDPWIQNTEHDCIRYRSGEGKGHCRQVANASSDYIGDIMEMVPPQIIEQSGAGSPGISALKKRGPGRVGMYYSCLRRHNP